MKKNKEANFAMYKFPKLYKKQESKPNKIPIKVTIFGCILKKINGMEIILAIF